MSEIKVGTLVTVLEDGHTPRKIATVDRVTKRYWIVDGLEYNKDNGQRCNSKWGPFYSIVPATDEHREFIITENCRHTLSRVNWRKVPGPVCVEICNLIKASEEEAAND